MFFLCTFPANGITRLVFWDTMGPDEQRTMKEMVSLFEREFPDIKVKLDSIPFSDAQGKFEFAASANVAPDIFRCEIAWTPLYAELGFLAPLEEMVEKTDLEDFLSAPLNYCVFGGHLWGLPQVTDCLALFYNKKIFSDASVLFRGRVKMPETWKNYDDFIESALLVNSFQKTRGSSYWALFLRGDSYFFQPWLWLFGGGLINEQGEILIDSNESVSGLKAFISLKDQLCLAPSEIDFANDYDNAMKGFKSGKYAMIVNGPWAVSDALSGEEFNPSKGGNPSDFGVAVIPSRKAFGSPVGGHNYVISRNCKNKVAALKFVCFMEKPEVQVEFALRNNLLPTKKKAFSLLMKKNFVARDVLQAFERQLQVSNNRPVIPEGGKLYSDFTRFFQKAFRGEISPEDAMGKVADEWRKLLGHPGDFKDEISKLKQEIRELRSEIQFIKSKLTKDSEGD
ncbi:extracellular solute-binding protein [bacterium]|nr:extracellular solute-binding protein [bacterium]